MCLASVNVNCRITSLAVHAPPGSAAKLLSPEPTSAADSLSKEKKKNATEIGKDAGNAKSKKKRAAEKRVAEKETDGGAVFAKKSKKIPIQKKKV